MAKMNEVIEGLKILQKYFDENWYNLGADHEVIYVYETKKPVEKQDIIKLIELGWDQDVSIKGDEFAEEDYDPRESWKVSL
jgi:hypothetical protein